MSEPIRIGGEVLVLGGPRVRVCGWPTGERTTCDQAPRSHKRDGVTIHEALCAYHGDLEFTSRWLARRRAAEGDSDVAALARLDRERAAWTRMGRRFYGGATPEADRRAGADA